MMSNHLHTIALPEFLQQTQEELDDKDFDITDLFCGNQLMKLPLDTVYQWLHHLGFKSKLRKKGSYIDNQKKPEMVAYYL